MFRLRQHHPAVPALSLATALLVWLASTHPALAQPGPGIDDIERAKKHYIDADAAMTAGDFKKAAAEYNAAYEITRDTVLFFKIGTAYAEAGDCEQARTFFGRYLAEGNPTDEFREMTNERMEQCQDSDTATGDATTGDTTTGDTTTTGDGAAGDASTGDGATGDGTTGDPDAGDIGDPMGGATPPPSFADSRPTWQRNAAWISVGTSLAFATVGAILGLSAASHEEDIGNLINFRDPVTNQPAVYTGNARLQYEELVSEGESLSNWSRITLGVAGVAAVTAAVFFIVDPGPQADKKSAHIIPTVSPESVGVTAGWRF